MPTIACPTRLIDLLGSILALVASLLTVALVCGLLCWRGVLEPSPSLIVVSLTVVVAIWAITPRRFFVSRRGAILTAVVVGLPVTVFGIEYLMTRSIQNSVSRIVDAGGSVSFDYAWEEHHYVKTRTGWIIPSWLRNSVGDCMLANVTGVYLGMGAATDENIGEFDLSHFTSVEFTASPLTDAAARTLRGQTQLEFLGLSHTQITDDALEDIRKLVNLRELWLLDTRVTDAGLQHVAGLTNLHTLILKDTDVTDAGVVELRRVLPRCQIHRR